MTRTSERGAASDPPRPAADRRYADPAWTGNPGYALLRRRHELFAEYLQSVADGIELDPAARRTADFVVRQAVAATAPVNWPWTNPTVLKKALETGGQSLLRGARNAVRDVVTNRGMPRQTTPGRLAPGRELAATPGSVVFRNRFAELIQYGPQTELVHETPLLVVPPLINRYYMLDLAPGRSLVEWAVQHGHTVFMISNRDADDSLRDATLSDYLREVPLAALDVVQEITGAGRVDVAALCQGGTLATATAAWLAARGEERINSLTLLNTLLDFTDPGDLGIFTGERAVARIERRMRRRGHLPAVSMKTTFDLLRPDDLLWNYVVAGWLLGEDPPPFDVLSWNADATRMPAALHTEYLRACYLGNRFADGTWELAGERLDLGAVVQDAYVVSAETDHIAPWTSVYAGAGLLGGDVRFVLSDAGHVAGVVNPPSPKARHRVGGPGALPGDPQQWRAAAQPHRASWWEDWAPWLARRAGAQRTPPPTGSAAHPPLQAAPGSYVHGR